MEDALRDEPPATFPVPEGLRCARVGPHGGPGGDSRLECFRIGSEPPPDAVGTVQLANGGQPEEPSALDFMRSDF